MNAYATWFGRIVWLGVTVNILLSVIALFIPQEFLAFMHLEPAIPTIWVRFSANLLILLSLFYIPGANDPYHYRANAILAVFARFVGFTFFLFNPWNYLMFGLLDLSFGIPEAILLFLAFRNEKSASSQPVSGLS